MFRPEVDTIPRRFALVLAFRRRGAPTSPGYRAATDV